jgi:hypothetical protein
MSRKALLLAGLLGLLLPVVRGQEAPDQPRSEKLPFGDAFYPISSWTYLEEKFPDIVKGWDSLDITKQIQAVSRVADDGQKRGKEVFQRYTELVSACGPTTMSQGTSVWNPYNLTRKPEPSCDLKTISSVSDRELDTLELWSRDPEGHKDTGIREQRDHARQLISDVQAGSLSEDDLAWAKANCSPMEAATMESAEQALLHSTEQSDAMMSGVRSAMDANFARGSIAGLHASLDEAGANGVFDGAAGSPGQTPTEGGAAVPLDRRLDDISLKTGSEKAFSRDWNEAMGGRLREAKDPVSAEILSGLDGRLPAVRIGARYESTDVAHYVQGGSLIVLNGNMVAQSMQYAVDKDPSLATEGCSHPGAADSAGLTACLHSNPKLMRAVVGDFEDVNVHELEHAVQDKRFGFDRTPGAPQMETTQIEREAFIKQLTWLSYHSDSPLFTSDSPLAKAARNDFRDYYRDPDAFLRDVDAREEGAPDVSALRDRQLANIRNAHQAALSGASWAPRALDRYAAGAKTLDKMDAYYADYFPKAEQDWKSRSPGALLQLAHFEKDPVTRLEDLAAARPRLAKGAEANWADSDIAKSQREAYIDFRTYPDRDPHSWLWMGQDPTILSDSGAYKVGRQLRDYEDSLTALGKPFPSELKDLRKTTYSRTLQQELAAVQRGGLSQRDRDFYIADALRFARALGDSNAERALMALQQVTSTAAR